MISGQLLSHKVAKSIFQQLSTDYNEADEINVVSKKLTIGYEDITGGREVPITITDLPEKSVLMHCQIYMTEVFSGTGVYARLNMGLGTIETDEVDFPETYNYKQLVFNGFALDTLGTNDPQGDISGSDAPKRLNKYKNTLVGYFTLLGVWTTSNNLNTARYNLCGCGSQTAGLSFSGYDTNYCEDTEEYDGSCWTTSNNLNTAKSQAAGCGTQTAGLSLGGFSGVTLGTTEEYDGTCWATVNAMNVARRILEACGTQTTGLCFGGYTDYATTEEYDGTSWTLSNDLNVARYDFGGFGTQSSGVAVGGAPATMETTEEYDGTNWSFGNNINLARSKLRGDGTQTAGLCFGGYTGVDVSITEEYDGTSWVPSNGLNSARRSLGGAGTQTAGLSFGGYNTSTYLATTEEYDVASLSDLTQGSLELYLTYTYQ